MGDTSNYLVYVVKFRRRKDKYRRSYVSFVDVCSKINFTEEYFGKLVISLSRVDNLRIEVTEMEKKCW